MTDEDIDQFLQDIQRGSVVVEPAPDATAAIVTADPDDDPIIATAIAASADVLCTLDRHLHTPTVVSYCQQHGIEVSGDVELLTRWKSPPEQTSLEGNVVP